MRAQQSFVSLPRMPSSAWAARPLASGAPFAVIGKRCFSRVRVGCPSFGGQRTDSGDLSRLLARSATGPNRHLTAAGLGAFASGFNSQMARWVAVGDCGSSSNGRWDVAGLCPAKLAALSHRRKPKAAAAGLTETAKIQSLSRQSRASFTVGVKSRLARWSSKGWFAKSGAAAAPNPSVKGTSCANTHAAPYLER